MVEGWITLFGVDSAAGWVDEKIESEGLEILAFIQEHADVLGPEIVEWAKSHIIDELS